MFRILVSALCLVFLLSSCQKEFLTESTKFETVQDELEQYFTEFQIQAALRQINIDFDNLPLTAHILEIEEDGVAGSCHYSSHNPNEIRIDQSFWNAASSLQREMVVFHELGHCVLARGHLEDANGSGICLSIMNSGLADCRVHYNQANKKLYLDELFSEVE